MWSSAGTFSGWRTARRNIICLLAHGVSLRLTTCMLIIYNFAEKVFDINDEDVSQTLPGTLEAFEAGVSSGSKLSKCLKRLTLTILGFRLTMAKKDRLSFRKTCS